MGRKKNELKANGIVNGIPSDVFFSECKLCGNSFYFALDMQNGRLVKTKGKIAQDALKDACKSERFAVEPNPCDDTDWQIKNSLDEEI
jgi:hypothetical protein